MNPLQKFVVKWDDCLIGTDPDIIRFSKVNDLESVTKVISDNPLSVTHFEPGSEMTALHYAASNRNLEITKALLSCNPPADVWKEDAYGRTAIQLAIETGRKELIDLLNEAMFPEFHQDPQPNGPAPD